MDSRKSRPGRHKSAGRVRAHRVATIEKLQPLPNSLATETPPRQGRAWQASGDVSSARSPASGSRSGSFHRLRASSPGGDPGPWNPTSDGSRTRGGRLHHRHRKRDGRKATAAVPAVKSAFNVRNNTTAAFVIIVEMIDDDESMTTTNFREMNFDVTKSATIRPPSNHFFSTFPHSPSYHQHIIIVS